MQYDKINYALVIVAELDLTSANKGSIEDYLSIDSIEDDFYIDKLTWIWSILRINKFHIVTKDVLIIGYILK